MVKISKADAKQTIRLLNILAGQGKAGAKLVFSGRSVSLETRNGKKTLPALIVKNAISHGLVISKTKRLEITAEGKSNLKRHLCDHDSFANQHRIVENVSVSFGNRSQKASINQLESPLDRLYNRKNKDGTRFISDYEFEAGGRLRRDFEKAQLQPSITSNWQLGVSTGSKNSAMNGAHDLSDIALDARSRLNNALEHLGPELSGVALDICCFLKGFEIVERERTWPQRAAKLMLKTALANLVRHYGFIKPEKINTKANRVNIRQWGVENYRPEIIG